MLANVGDSRTYLFRHDRLRRVTVDHSYVQELVATGHISEDEARVHPRRNIITRALGIEPDVRVDWWTLPLIRGDRFVLCSDGLVDEVADTDITTILLDTPDPQEAAEALVDAANAAGGRDNITVIVVDVLDGDDPPDPTLEIDVVPVWADAATRPTPAGPFALDPDAPADATGPLERTAVDGDEAPSKRSGLAKFAIAFAAAAAIVVAVVVFSAWARGGYYVAFNSEGEAIVYRGKDGGVLWIDPTAQTAGGPTATSSNPTVPREIDDHARFDSKDEAAEFIRDERTTTTTTTTTTTSTTTTTLPPTTDRSIPPRRIDPNATGGGAAVPTGATTTSSAMTVADEFAAGRGSAPRTRRSPRRRRNTELTLLVMAALITGVGLHDHGARHERRDPAGNRCLRRHPRWACSCARTSSCASSPAGPTARCCPSPHCSTASAS